MTTWITIFAVVMIALLGWNLYRRFGTDRIAGFNQSRRAGSKIVSRGEFVDGNRHLDVALALTQSTLYYENADMEASIDLEWIREVEYTTELATGAAIGEGKVLRLRSQSQTFEFVLPKEHLTGWQMLLPPRSEPERTAAAPSTVTATAATS